MQKACTLSFGDIRWLSVGLGELINITVCAASN